MAEFLGEFLGESLRQAFKKLWRALCETSDEVVEWFREVATPPPGLHLESEDGSSFTGLVLVERNVVVAVLAVRHPVRAPKRGPGRDPFGGGFNERPPPWNASALGF